MYIQRHSAINHLHFIQKCLKTGECVCLRSNDVQRGLRVACKIQMKPNHRTPSLCAAPVLRGAAGGERLTMVTVCGLFTGIMKPANRTDWL